jgi:predicted nucleotide-binding protein (sugar kinase/HSP70/actin superfamily)
MIRKIKTMNPEANIVPIDYDPSATEVNQENRIKLMLAVARENLKKANPNAT